MEFYFIPTNLIPDGGSLVLTLPNEFILEASFPEIEIEAP